MMSISSRATLTALAAGLMMAATSQPSQAAGLFDFLFGGFSAPQPRYDYGLPLDVRVNPERRRKAVVANRPEHKAKLQVAIDPVKNPSWYLDDPTLRRGDIVVLKGRALVYDGGRGERTAEDFTPLQKSNLVSRSERERVDRMSKGNAGVAAAVQPDGAAITSKGKEAALR